MPGVGGRTWDYDGGDDAGAEGAEGGSGEDVVGEVGGVWEVCEEGEEEGGGGVGGGVRHVGAELGFGFGEMVGVGGAHCLMAPWKEELEAGLEEYGGVVGMDIGWSY